MVGGDVQKFRVMIDDLAAHNLDTVMFTNNVVDRDAKLLEVTDAQDFNVLMLPADDLNRQWWPDSVEPNADTASMLARSLVEPLQGHPSLKGYVIKDEPDLSAREKVELITQAFRTHDPARLVMPLLIGIDRVAPLTLAAQPDVLLLDVYPIAKQNQPCDLTMRGFDYPFLDMVSYIRVVSQARSPKMPLWIILQTHAFANQLREPQQAELRLQHWIAIGEGATGIFWFVYSSQQGWKGLADNQALYAEVTSLTQRLGPLRPLLLGLHRVDHQLTVASNQSAYISVLVNDDRSKQYAVVVNRSCNPAALTVLSQGRGCELRNLESQQVYKAGEAIPFRPGDGHIFEVVQESKDAHSCLAP